MAQAQGVLLQAAPEVSWTSTQEPNLSTIPQFSSPTADLSPSSEHVKLENKTIHRKKTKPQVPQLNLSLPIMTRKGLLVIVTID